MELSPIEKLKRRTREVAHLNAVLALLDWDSAVEMSRRKNRYENRDKVTLKELKVKREMIPGR